MLSSQSSFFDLLDQEEGTKGVITSNDINIFLSSKKVQSKGITQEDVENFLKKAVYLNMSARQKKAYNNPVKNEAGQQVMSAEIKEMFGLSTTVDKTKITDETGTVKKGFEVFDLNNDGKFDEIENAYFSSGGHAVSNNPESFTLETFSNAVNALDKYGFNPKYGNVKDGKITEDDKKQLYTTLGAIYYMLENIKGLPEDVQQKYADILKTVNIGYYEDNRVYEDGGTTVGGYYEGTVSLNTKMVNKKELAALLIHELTHAILHKQEVNSSILQEVETFYMEYKLYNELKESGQDPLQDETRNKKFPVYNKEYINHIDELKTQYPQYSEKEIAVRAFMDMYYDIYAKQLYNDRDVSIDIENAAKTAKFVYLK